MRMILMATVNPSRSRRSSTPGPACSHQITARDVCVHYGSTVALAPSSMVADAGESIALVGANGSGKTTLLSLIAGVVDPTGGDLVVDGTVALVDQHHDHHRWMPMSVDEVLKMGRYRQHGLIGRFGSDDRDIIDRSAVRLGVDDLRRRPFGALSGGQQQRVVVARSLIMRPDVLLLDEPITGLDPPSQETIMAVIDDHVASGGVAIFSTHHLGEAQRADRVILLGGSILADGSPDEIMRPDVLGFGGHLQAIGDTLIPTDPAEGVPHYHRSEPHVERHRHHHRALAARQGCREHPEENR